MASKLRTSLAQVKALARAVHLDLPQERLELLARSYSEFLVGFEKVRAIDTGDREPATPVPSLMSYKEE